MHLVLKELNGHLRTHNFDVGVEVDQITNQAGMVGFGMADDQDIDVLRINFSLQ